MSNSGVDPLALADAAIAAVAALGEVSTAALPVQQLRALIDREQALAAAAEAVLLSGVRAVDTRPETVPEAMASRAASALLRARRVSPRQASLDTRVARATDPDTGTLPRLGTAFAEGLVWRGHLDVAVRALDRIPTRLLTKVAPRRPPRRAADRYLPDRTRLAVPTLRPATPRGVPTRRPGPRRHRPPRQ